jgi:hypothetical protein
MTISAIDNTNHRVPAIDDGATVGARVPDARADDLLAPGFWLLTPSP